MTRRSSAKAKRAISGSFSPGIGSKARRQRPRLIAPAAVLTIDMVVFDNPSQLAKPFAQATVEIKLHRELRQANAAVGVYVLSLGGSFIEKKVDGAGLALRTMVGLAVVQMLGRRFRLPYTRCLDTPMHRPAPGAKHPRPFCRPVAPRTRQGHPRTLAGLWRAGAPPRALGCHDRHAAETAQTPPRAGVAPGQSRRAYLAVYTNLPLPPRTRPGGAKR